MENSRQQEASDSFLQWGNRKRTRFSRTTTTNTNTRSNAIIKRSSSSSPDKPKRNNNNTNNKNNNNPVGVGVGVGNSNGIKRDQVWPKLNLVLSDKEKEEDFMAMKGCKLPQRPKKRPKAVQKTLLMVYPGLFLADIYQGKYEIQEKRSSKKRPRGLKAMGSLESDTE